MIKMSVTFFGDSLEKDGMPKDYYSYIVISSQNSNENCKSAIASILPFDGSKGSHYSVTAGGEQAAFKKAISALKKKHPKLQKRQIAL